MTPTEQLLVAEGVLAEVVQDLTEECKPSWPRDRMQKHVNDRATLIKARRILLDRADAAIKKGAS